MKARAYSTKADHGKDGFRKFVIAVLISVAIASCAVWVGISYGSQTVSPFVAVLAFTATLILSIVSMFSAALKDYEFTRRAFYTAIGVPTAAILIFGIAAVDASSTKGSDSDLASTQVTMFNSSSVTKEQSLGPAGTLAGTPWADRQVIEDCAMGSNATVRLDAMTCFYVDWIPVTPCFRLDAIFATCPSPKSAFEQSAQKFKLKRLHDWKDPDTLPVSTQEEAIRNELPWGIRLKDSDEWCHADPFVNPYDLGIAEHSRVWACSTSGMVLFQGGAAAYFNNTNRQALFLTMKERSLSYVIALEKHDAFWTGIYVTHKDGNSKKVEIARVVY